MLCVYLAEKMRKDFSVSSHRKYIPCSHLYICDVGCEKGLTLGLFFFLQTGVCETKALNDSHRIQVGKTRKQVCPMSTNFEVQECTVKNFACFFFPE